jgi:AcrR family transcriptional regulator
MDKPNSLTNKTNSSTTEARILAGARQEFIEQGLKGARMQSIASRSGVNKALLHYYFRSKERLYQAVFRDIMQTMQRAMKAHLSGMELKGGIRPFLHGFITTYITTLRDNADFPRFILREIAEGGNNMPKVIEMLAPSVRDVPPRINKLLKKEMDSGNIRRMDPLHLMLNVLGVCIFTFIAQPILAEINRQMKIGISFDGKFFDTRIDAVLEMVLHGISCEHPKGK